MDPKERKAVAAAILSDAIRWSNNMLVDALSNHGEVGLTPTGREYIHQSLKCLELARRQIKKT